MAEEVRLRSAALRGGAYLAGRQLVSLLLKLVGVVLITRVLGPSKYGAYVSSLSIYNYLLAIGSAGVGVYLLRHEGEIPEIAYRTAYSVLLGMGLTIFAAVEFGSGVLAQWTGVEGFEPVMRVIVFGIPAQLLAIPASVRLERRLNYKAVAINEILGQVAFYVVAVPMIMGDYGPKSLAFGWAIGQLVSNLCAHVASKSVPTFAFNREAARAIVRYATEFSIANWIWQLRLLVNPLIVGPALGATGVGIVGMTVGLLEMLTVLKGIAWRLSLAILTKFRADESRMRLAITDGMELQVLAVGTLLLGFGWTGAFIVPRLFGERWIGVMDLYPFVALSYLTMSAFNIHSAAASVLNRNRSLAAYNLVSVGIFLIAAYLAVPRLGIVGYGYAEVATLPAYLVMHRVIATAIGSPDYRLMAIWWIGTSLGLFWRLDAWLITAPFLALLVPMSMRKLRKYVVDGMKRV